jgi:hypothetical protein
MHEHTAVGAIPQEEIHQQIVRQLVKRTLNEYEANRQAEQFLLFHIHNSAEAVDKPFSILPMQINQ